MSGRQLFRCVNVRGGRIVFVLLDLHGIRVFNVSGQFRMLDRAVRLRCDFRLPADQLPKGLRGSGILPDRLGIR